MEEAPFVFGRTASRADFADRDAERARLIGNFNSGVNTVIISPRRWGKSSLVNIAAQDAVEQVAKLRTCRIDVFNARTETDFYAQLAKGVLRATSTRWEEWAEAASRFLTHFRPKISFSADPSAEVTLDLDWEEARRSPAEILDLAENIATAKKLKLAVCVDEFQSIADYADTLAVQRTLRAHWQQHQHVSYCLFGSKQHMLTGIFSNPSMPFYKFGDIMLLPKIDNTTWGEFIARRFADTGKQISQADGCHLAALVENHPYYAQQLAQMVWFRSFPTANTALIDTTLTTLKDQLSLLFTNLTQTMTTRQLRLLRAVLADENELSSQATLKRYDLGTSANVTRLKEALLNREIIDVSAGRVSILDPLFAHWLRTDYFRS
ncbi:MAG: ATP-binding protein [Actinomycetia bacterium]|nr:ATP-binding protein [Actinomycetes bacterium]